ncbi:hypothetical protein CTI12_AA446240 [Artemisia annua]|uniref:Uncharacterized protein n=1 Tax=Artemisia annua TaxID=35608 RepID=A0A2U1LU83_ARTAN|nr:hypothetical protein CTI12_AA446240 [Artemisia annua]
MSSSGNDPRQPSTAKPYKPQPIHPDNLPIDYSGFLAIICGVAGVMFKVTFFIILGDDLIFMFSCYCTLLLF